MIRYCQAICGVMLLLGSYCHAADTPSILHADFNRPDALAKWRGVGGKLVAIEDRKCLLLEASGKNPYANRAISLPVKRIAGKLITIRAKVRAADVSRPPKPWNGIKIMLVVKTGSHTDYPQIKLPQGTFGWTEVQRTIRLPDQMSSATLQLGLELVSGKVWFDDIRVTLGRGAVGGRRLTAPFTGHNLKRLRGVMHGPTFDEKNIRDLAAWGANHVRWQLNWVPMKQAEEWARDLDRYDRWLEGAMAHADKAVDACEKHGIKMLLDLHCPPGGRSDGGVCRMFTDKRYQQKFLDVWTMLAKRYKGRKIIYAYDLINEPVDVRVHPKGVLAWRELATEAARRIRKIDPGKPIVFEPGPWGSCEGFDEMTPLDIDSVIYSFHMYQPHVFTHQFQKTREFPRGVEYPGKIRGVKWDKARLLAAMRPALDFQREFNVHIYVGEFSAIRWAPNESAYRYNRDLIELFEAAGWDWAYHAYREWQGWSVEHGTDKRDTSPSKSPTKRKTLLLKYFARNQRPGGAKKK
jgi:endoglucanase